MNTPEMPQDLPLTSSHWGTYRVESDGERVRRLHPFEKDRDPSEIGQGILDVQDGPTRIQRPSIRESFLKHGAGTNNQLRGAEPFVEVSWEEAEALTASTLKNTIADYGNQAIYAGSYGWSSAGRFHHAQSQIHRFLNCIGGYTRSVNTYSFAAAEVIVPHVIGESFFDCLINATGWPSIIGDADLLVAFGGMPIKNGQINAGGVGQHVQRDYLQLASESGVEMVNISPIRSDLGGAGNVAWLPLNPGSDVALMLALAHTLHIEGLTDQSFVDRYSVGMDRFTDHLLGKQDGQIKSAEWAGELCAIAADDIIGLARKMAQGRTMISVSWSLSRQQYGEQPYWAAIALATMLGQIGLPGGGIGFGYSATNSIGNHKTIIPSASLPQGKNPVNQFIPVARICDMLLNPGSEYDYNGSRHTYPDIHAVYWAGGNPFHHHQDLNRLLAAWQKPGAIIVHDWCWNSLAKHADIVLPCTTTLERQDIAFSPRDPYVISMNQVAKPAGESRDDYAILSSLARQFDVEAAFTENRSSAEWLQWIYDSTVKRARDKGIDMPDWQQFQKDGWFVPNAPEKPDVMLDRFIQDPDGNPLSTPTGKIEIWSETVASFQYPDCPGHPVWQEPDEWLGQKDNTYPLQLISNQPRTRLHSQLDHGQVSRGSKIKDREPVTLHHDDAEARGISAGQVVEIFNRRGSCLAGAVISDDVRPGVVQLSVGAWMDQLQPGVPGSVCKHGNANMVTRDFGTSRLAQGPTAMTCMVDIRVCADPPVVTAFSAPSFCDR